MKDVDEGSGPKSRCTALAAAHVNKTVSGLNKGVSSCSL